MKLTYFQPIKTSIIPVYCFAEGGVWKKKQHYLARHSHVTEFDKQLKLFAAKRNKHEKMWQCVK